MFQSRCACVAVLQRFSIGVSMIWMLMSFSINQMIVLSIKYQKNAGYNILKLQSGVHFNYLFLSFSSSSLELAQLRCKSVISANILDNIGSFQSDISLLELIN